MKRRGLTIMELLVVIAILVILAALVMPHLAAAHWRGKVAASTSNLRQLSVALHLYLEANDQQYPARIEDFVDPVRQRELLASPTDRSTGSDRPATRRLGTKVSYHYLWDEPRFRAALLAADPNHVVLYDPTVSRDSSPVDGMDLRARRDGSIRMERPRLLCVQMPGGGVASGRSVWTRFTDVWPCPPGIPGCMASQYDCNDPPPPPAP